VGPVGWVEAGPDIQNRPLTVASSPSGGQILAFLWPTVTKETGGSSQLACEAAECRKLPERSDRFTTARAETREEEWGLFSSMPDSVTAPPLWHSPWLLLGRLLSQSVLLSAEEGLSGPIALCTSQCSTPAQRTCHIL
jgi:hypothetical protein